MILKFNFLQLPEYVLARLHRIDRGGDKKDLPFQLFKVWTKLYLIVQNSDVPLHISEYCVLVHNLRFQQQFFHLHCTFNL